WESWDYHLREAFERTDSIARKMFAEASLFSVPREKARSFLQSEDGGTVGRYSASDERNIGRFRSAGIIRVFGRLKK
ncbi:hypothetical protein, partial [Paenibacillus alvei]